VLPVQNLTFTQFNPGNFPPKTLLTNADPVGWTGGTGLISIDAPGTATETGGPGNAYPVYGPFADPPPGGNFIQADGNPTFETSFNQVINGLTVGTDYSLSFWQAAGQQQGFSGATTEQWKVFLGTGSFSVNCGTNPCTVSTGDMTEDDTAIMNTPSQRVHGWELVSMDFLASASSETLSFLGLGRQWQHDQPSADGVPCWRQFAGAAHAGAVDMGDDDHRLRWPRLHGPSPSPREAGRCNSLSYA
jgi:hypothetical protein